MDRDKFIIIHIKNQIFVKKTTTKNQNPTCLVRIKWKYLSFNIFNETLNYFLNGTGILNVLYISGKMKKKKKKVKVFA